MAIQFVTDQFKDDAVTADKVELDTGNFHFASGASLRWAGTVSADTDVATKAYVDSTSQGLDLKESVMVATTANITLSGTQTIDGVAVTADKRVLVKDQSTGTENGIYLCKAGAWSRADDFATGDDEAGAFTFVEQGTVNGDNGFVCTNNAGDAVVGTDALTFTQFSGAGQITAGSALSKSGNTLNVEVDGSSIEVSSDALQVKASGITNAMLAGSIANGKLANSTVSFGGISLALGGSDATPAFDLTDATNYPTSSLSGTITNAQLAGSIADSKLLTISTAGKVALSALEIDGGTDIGADLADADLMIVDDGAGGANRKSAMSRIPTYVFSKVAGGDVLIDSAGDATIQAGAVTNAMLAGSIADSKLSTIATADKVSGSAVQLATASALEDSTGLRLKAAVAGDGIDLSNAQVLSVSGVTNAMISNSASIAISKLAASTVTVTDGSNSTAISLGGTITFDAVSFVESSGQILIKQGGIDFSMLKATPTLETNTTANGSTTAFALTNDITTAAWRNAAMVFRNGQLCKRVSSGPSDSSEYTIASSAGSTTVTFGGAPATNELLTFSYFSE